MRVAGRPRREARPERVAQRAAGQREAERVVLVHRVGDEAEAAAGVDHGEGRGGQRVHGGWPTCKHYAQGRANPRSECADDWQRGQVLT